MKPTTKPKRTAEQRAEEEAIRRQHATNPIRQQPAGAINRQSFMAILGLVARFKAARENQGLTLAEVADRMGIDPPLFLDWKPARCSTPRWQRCTNGRRHWARSWNWI